MKYKFFKASSQLNNINSSSIHYPALDGLRGIAILLVVFYHNFEFINYFFFGWLGVDLFFVLSGFLITNILLKNYTKENFLKNFFTRRILRIFPLYFFFLLFFILVFGLIKPTFFNLEYYINNQIWFWAYLQNWLFIFNPIPENTNALNHLWSLAVEEQFYIFSPILVIIFKNPKTIFKALLALLIIIICLRFLLWIFKIESLAYYNLYTFTRIDGLCIGSMLAAIRIFNPEFITKNFTFAIFGLAGINFIFYFFNSNYHFSFPYLAIVGYTTFAILFALLINDCISNEKSFYNKILSLPIFRFFGTISYGLYIFHWPIYLICTKTLTPKFLENFPLVHSSILTSVIAFQIAIILAYLSYNYFEIHFLKLKNVIAAI